MHLKISKGMPLSPDQLYCIQVHLWASHIQRLCNDPYLKNKIFKKFTFGFADRQFHVTLVSQAFHVHVFHPFLQINRTVDLNQSKL